MGHTGIRTSAVQLKKMLTDYTTKIFHKTCVISCVIYFCVSVFLCPQLCGHKNTTRTNTQNTQNTQTYRHTDTQTHKTHKTHKHTRHTNTTIEYYYYYYYYYY